MANKAQKPASALQVRRPERLARRGPTLFAVTDRPRTVPRPPRDLDPVAVRAWRAFWRGPAGAVTNYAAHGPALESWIRWVSEGEKTRELVARAPTMPGSQGQAAPNALIAYLRLCLHTIERYEEQYGMTPLAAMRLNIATSQAAHSVHDLNRKLDQARESPHRDAAEPPDVIVLEEIA